MSRSEASTVRAEIETFIRDGAFRLAYQPIVDLDTADVVGVEALCRFDDGASTEGRFKACERVGLAPDLDLAIIERIVSELPTLPDGYVSINLSPSTVLDERLGERLLASDVPADRVVIEVTEHAHIPDYERAEQLLAVVRGTGIRLAVDDAGAGYATFRHILSLRPDIIKMDRSITQDVDCDSARQALASALVIFGNDIRATVIAEGVETPDEILALRRAGIHHAQGFALARPAGAPVPPIDYAPVDIDASTARASGDGAARARPPRSPGDEVVTRDVAMRRLRGAVDALQAVQSHVADNVALARGAGISWGDIADVIGLTRQGVTKRYGRKNDS